MTFILLIGIIFLQAVLLATVIELYKDTLVKFNARIGEIHTSMKSLLNDGGYSDEFRL